MNVCLKFLSFAGRGLSRIITETDLGKTCLLPIVNSPDQPSHSSCLLRSLLCTNSTIIILEIWTPSFYCRPWWNGKHVTQIKLLLYNIIVPDKHIFSTKKYQNFPISPQKHMLWVLIRRALLRCFWWVPITCFLWRNKNRRWIHPLICLLRPVQILGLIWWVFPRFVSVISV